MYNEKITAPSSAFVCPLSRDQECVFSHLISLHMAEQRVYVLTVLSRVSVSEFHFLSWTALSFQGLVSIPFTLAFSSYISITKALRRGSDTADPGGERRAAAESCREHPDTCLAGTVPPGTAAASCIRHRAAPTMPPSQPRSPGQVFSQ